MKYKKYLIKKFKKKTLLKKFVFAKINIKTNKTTNKSWNSKKNMWLIVVNEKFDKIICIFCWFDTKFFIIIRALLTIFNNVYIFDNNIVDMFLQ